MSEFWIPFLGAGIAGIAAFLGSWIQGRVVHDSLIEAMAVVALAKERKKVAEEIVKEVVALALAKERKDVAEAMITVALAKERARVMKEGGK